MPNITTDHAITYTNTKDRNIDYTTPMIDTKTMHSLLAKKN